ncbi:50S ribosomal protein L25/general stress protein Ctc [Coxiella endosymbiont of Ornithodoros amblus]|uniref:50S ribosomal protein L25/general stress protein Ctc n=1 Tax=Coxiella endosymbiont of Ornithodoros amblus TaxID=1656166 RepID=UPI00244E3CC9|nr:50S ribosomal protein L25/general stress protein Ctc [Coxiella endosymbiont of Ornithodoros amblus]MBW5802590.1 50S ribosomal protein L25/general stress protein Ctc [Coxiella endosymbiont of Ornithodoros amblus]
MAAESFELIAELREFTGKSAARRMRRFEDKVPGIVYGAGKAPKSITLLQKDLLKALESESTFSSILTLKVGDKKQKVILKSLQRHQTKLKIVHIDFQRIKASETLIINVPLHFLGEDDCPGVEAGGVVSHLQSEVKIRCLPADLPEYIEVDLSHLQLDESVHLSNLKLPAGVELTSAVDEKHDSPIASVHMPRVNKSDVEAAEEEGAEKPASEAEANGEAGQADTDKKE